jgi:DNA-binding transcriptional ArsR family regulator
VSRLRSSHFRLGWNLALPKTKRPWIRLTSNLTRKVFLTYIESMVVTPDREPDVFAAISHPARRRMLDLLVEADRSVNTIAGHFQMSRPAVSQHLRILLDAGLVTEQRHGRERRYRLVAARLGPVRDWIARYERFWDAHLQRLQKYLTEGNEK